MFLAQDKLERFTSCFLHAVATVPSDEAGVFP